MLSTYQGHTSREMGGIPLWKGAAFLPNGEGGKNLGGKCGRETGEDLITLFKRENIKNFLSKIERWGDSEGKSVATKVWGEFVFREKKDDAFQKGTHKLFWSVITEHGGNTPSKGLSFGEKKRLNLTRRGKGDQAVTSYTPERGRLTTTNGG